LPKDTWTREHTLLLMSQIFDPLSKINVKPGTSLELSRMISKEYGKEFIDISIQDENFLFGQFVGGFTRITLMAMLFIPDKKARNNFLFACL
jgi:hypothetical protein